MAQQMELIVGDITKQSVDVIVNAANRTLLGGGGVDGAIHAAAGKELLEECWTLNGCETGEAKITGGYKLPAKHVIHTAGPVYQGTEEDAKLLYSSYHNSLELAKEHDLHSIAFPAISCGVYGYPAEEATPIALKAIREWLAANPSYDMRVILVCFDREMEAVYQKYMSL